MNLVRKKKVICYFLRQNNGERELLVFNHRDYPESGTQVIGGTVEEGEILEETMKREIFEEAGLKIHLTDLRFLGVSEYQRKDRPEINERTYYMLDQQSCLPDYWEHTVKSDGEDDGMVFCFYWISVKRAKDILTGNFHEMTEKIPE